MSKGRVVVVTQCYHQPEGEEPTSAIIPPYEIPLISMEQGYGPRRMTFDHEWKPLDFGWLSDKAIGTVVLTNHGSSYTPPTRNPTEEQQAEELSLILEVAILPAEKPPNRTMHEATAWPPMVPIPFARVTRSASLVMHPSSDGAAHRYIIRSTTNQTVKAMIQAFPA